MLAAAADAMAMPDSAASVDGTIGDAVMSTSRGLATPEVFLIATDSQ